MDSANAVTVAQLQRVVMAYYSRHGRNFPWRQTRDPYCILISEVMLQQTQTTRVADYYPRFLQQFPTVEQLAEAPLSAVLKLWSGLGYNRRARALRDCAQQVVERHQGKLPRDFNQLIELPGIGSYTAGAIQAFAFNLPAVFVETNIRTVMLHHFFQSRRRVDEAEIRTMVAKSILTKDPRSWYYALMDYGVYLKAQTPHLNRKSSSYKKQSPFKGSVRQERGRMLKQLLAADGVSKTALLGSPCSVHAEKAFADLAAEKLLFVRNKKVYLAR